MIQDLKEKKASPIDVRQFLTGCTVMMNTMKLEMQLFDLIEELNEKKGT